MMPPVLRRRWVLAMLLLVGTRAQAEPDSDEQRLTPPVLTDRVEAPYPAEAEHAGREGVVLLELFVDATGQVADAKVIGQAGFGFDEAALEAVRQFRFSPGRYGGKPVPVKVTFRSTRAARKRDVARVGPTARSKSGCCPSSRDR
jgi:vitamin B12 transporter